MPSFRQVFEQEEPDESVWKQNSSSMLEKSRSDEGKSIHEFHFQRRHKHDSRLSSPQSSSKYIEIAGGGQRHCRPETHEMIRSTMICSRTSRCPHSMSFLFYSILHTEVERMSNGAYVCAFRLSSIRALPSLPQLQRRLPSSSQSTPAASRGRH